MNKSKSTLSVVISAYNAASSIEETLKSVKNISDDIVVIDNNSSDKTREISLKYTDRVYQKQNDMMLNVNKNFGFDKATGEFILNLDSDEIVTSELAKEIRGIVDGKSDSNIDYDGYWIKRKNISFGKWIEHGLWWPDKQLRLFRKSKGRFPCSHIHEYIKVDGPVGELKEAYLHNNYQTISQFITKLDRCTTSESEYLIESGYMPHWKDAFSFPVSDFVKIYFSQEGYKDGLHGLVLSMLQAFYAFVVFAKAWEKRGFVKQETGLHDIAGQLRSEQKEISYWYLTSGILNSTNYLEKLILKFFRKLVLISKNFR